MDYVVCNLTQKEYKQTQKERPSYYTSNTSPLLLFHLFTSHIIISHSFKDIQNFECFLLYELEELPNQVLTELVLFLQVLMTKKLRGDGIYFLQKSINVKINKYFIIFTMRQIIKNRKSILDVNEKI